jgi:hypothetical protein
LSEVLLKFRDHGLCIPHSEAPPRSWCPESIAASEDHRRDLARTFEFAASRPITDTQIEKEGISRNCIIWQPPDFFFRSLLNGGMLSLLILSDKSEEKVPLLCIRKRGSRFKTATAGLRECGCFVAEHRTGSGRMRQCEPRPRWDTALNRN